jgi:hypothetical protein
MSRLNALFYSALSFGVLALAIQGEQRVRILKAEELRQITGAQSCLDPYDWPCTADAGDCSVLRQPPNCGDGTCNNSCSGTGSSVVCDDGETYEDCPTTENPTGCGVYPNPGTIKCKTDNTGKKCYCDQSTATWSNSNCPSESLNNPPDCPE